MAIEFRGVRFPPLRDLTVSAPSGAVIGIIGEKGAGKGALLRLASGEVKPEAGEVIVSGESRYLGPLDALQLSPVDVLLIEHSLAQHDALVHAPGQLPLLFHECLLLGLAPRHPHRCDRARVGLFLRPNLVVIPCTVLT